MKQTIETLPLAFMGRGETKDFSFKQVEKSAHGYIYEVSSSKKPHYEVFAKQVLPKCIDFAKHLYSDTESKENYPKKNAFGKTAWTCLSLDRAQTRLIMIDITAEEKEVGNE